MKMMLQLVSVKYQGLPCSRWKLQSSSKMWLLRTTLTNSQLRDDKDTFQDGCDLEVDRNASLREFIWTKNFEVLSEHSLLRSSKARLFYVFEWLQTCLYILLDPFRHSATKEQSRCQNSARHLLVSHWTLTFEITSGSRVQWSKFSVVSYNSKCSFNRADNCWHAMYHNGWWPIQTYHLVSSVGWTGALHWS